MERAGHRAATRLEDHLRSALGAPRVPEPLAGAAELRRRRIVVAVVTVVGATVLGWSLNVEPGSGWFYAATLVLAAVWTIGAFVSGPLHLGRVGREPEARRPVVPAIAIGAGLAAVFVLGALVVREIPVLGDAVEGILAYAREGVGPIVVVVTIVNGIAEELFFRGAMFAAVPAAAAVLVTTVVYTLASIASGNLMLGFAALVLGTVVGLERRASGGILAPALTHVTWSTLMLLVLPPLFH